MRLILVILAVVGLSVIGVAVAIGTGALNIAALGPTTRPRPAAANVDGGGDAGPATLPADEPFVVPPPPLLSDRAIVLDPENAKLSGKVILADTTFSGEKRNARREERRPGRRPVYPLLTRFATPDDAADWAFAVPEAGRYSVTVDYSLPGRGEDKGGAPYVLGVADETLRFNFTYTHGASAFQLVDVGTAYLPAGQTHLTLRPEARATGGVLNVRGVRLFPVD